MNLPQAQAEVEEWNTMIVVAIAILGVALVVWWKLDSLYAIARGMWNHVRPVVQWFVFLGGSAAMHFSLFSWNIRSMLNGVNLGSVFTNWFCLSF